MTSNNTETKKRRTRRQRVVRFFIRLFAWVAVIIIYYFSFSLLFDTPYEHKIRQSTKLLKEEYNRLSERYDSLEMVLDNITAREKGVFRTLFEADPYDLDVEQSEERVALYEKNVSKSKSQLASDLEQKISDLSQRADELENSWKRIKELGDNLGEKSKNIPSIQPVLNQQLTLLTAGYGTILNPFYRTLKSHQGVDYTVAEGSSVFATADGVVKEISDKSSTLGKTIIIDHGNGYKTSYSHLLSVGVRRGQKVQRGDIIALSGNSGLSLAPHLHYEVRYNDLRIDPIHYFYMELSPVEYQRIMRIAQSGMQSFD
ncbi:MAG: peptidoglycan DD-metalloendopeptidase family protein [Alistipes sp.]|nr:peptidoglycan DD-metalloendopeptidase family protein [Alistipes sp.]MBQ1957578.1 peptidoglycan DD-metalloendopeptidase family protein [Alistipes sp.]MBQ2416270.1 peptidoglycan DD-metalloendopeptidase family protein [Alistipes sp.]MBQ5623704.1 peptidoglycan DD-metalloendopeptidase family protein [Alistipes sp.]MBQ5784887.1 peptidoglycan DD-metalloendopeptidase family protein [Alistipes sp.]